MDEVTLFLVKNFKVNLNKPIVVGVSGGPDSMALLNFLRNYDENLKIVVAHVNHGVREESETEEKFVRKYCKDNDLIFESLKLDLIEEGNFHKEARKMRYAFFEEILKKYNAQYLFTAHHADDLIETILMRITRGSTLKGYSGFSSVINIDNYVILRPFITLNKEEILKYCYCNNIPFVVDGSNESSKYTRNRFRKDVLSFLKKENPKVHKQFKQFSETLLEYNDFVNVEVKKIFKEVVDHERLDIKKLKEEHILIQELVIRKILDLIYDDDIVFITKKHVKNIMNLYETGGPNAYIELPLGIEVRRNYDNLEFIKKQKKIENYKITLKNENKIDGKFIIRQINSTKKDNNNICRINKEEVSMPLYLRNRIEGDLMEVKGLNGRKKIKDIFIDEKVELEKRNRLPLLVDSEDKIIWIPGIKKSKYCKKINESYDIIFEYIEEGYIEKE